MQTYKKQIAILLFLSIISLTVAHEDDEDNILGELIVDLMIGGAIEICTSFHTCSVLLNIFTMAVITCALIGLCINGCKDCRLPTEREAKRGIRRGLGIYAGRRLVRGFT